LHDQCCVAVAEADAVAHRRPEAGIVDAFRHQRQVSNGQFLVNQQGLAVDFGKYGLLKG